MKLFILLLVFAVLLQTTAVPLNLALALIISRSFIKSDLSNYYLAFFAGIFLGLLSNTNIGFYPLAFLIIVKLCAIVKQFYFSSNVFLILPVSLVLFVLMSFSEQIFLNQTFNLRIIIFEAIATFPIYIFVNFWEERFIRRSDIKLKIKK